MLSAIWALRSLRSSRLRTTAGADSRWYSATISATAGNSAATTSISRQSSQSIATIVPASTIRLSSITNSTCTYSVFTASVSLVTRLTSWPVIARSKKLIGRRSTCRYTSSRTRCTERIATPASRVSWP